MVVATNHPLAEVMLRAAQGIFPLADGRATSLGSLHGPCDVVEFWAGHAIVAADVTQGWVDENYVDPSQLGPGRLAGGIGLFFSVLLTRLGVPANYPTTLLCAPPRDPMVHGTITEGGEPDETWAAYRSNVRCYRYSSPGASGGFAVGNGPGGRWDVYFRVEEGPGGRVGRELLAAAKTTLPEKGAPLFGSAPLHDPRVLRILMASGFQALCTEVLLLTK